MVCELALATKSWGNYMESRGGSASGAGAEPRGQNESISLYLASGETETVPNCTSISYENGKLVCRDRDGYALRTLSAAALAFASRSPDVAGLNVWI